MDQFDKTRFENNLERFIKIDLESGFTVRHMELANEAVGSIQSLQRFFRAIKGMNLSLLTPNFQKRLSTDLEESFELLNKIREINERTIPDFIDAVNRDTAAHLAGVVDRFGGALAFANLDAKVTQKEGDLGSEHLSKVEELTQLIVEHAAESERTLAGIRKAAGEIGVTQHGIIFKGEADAQAKAARNWLKAAAAAASLLVMLAIIWYLMIESGAHVPNDPYQFTVFMANKVLLVGIFIYIFTSAVKNYHNHKHNELVNQHRHNALLTYRAILEGSTSESTKDIVLAHAAACIFSPQDTGFSGNKDDSTGPKAVLELLANPTSRKD